MSSEYNLHLHDEGIQGRVRPLSPTFQTTIVRIQTKGNELALFVPDTRLLELSLLFHKIAQDLAALLPDVDACCRCVPGTPDDQCAAHGFGAFRINRAHAQGSPATGTIPIEEAAEHVEPPHRWG